MRPSIPGLIAGGATVAGLAAVLILNPTQAASSTDSSDLSASQAASSANTSGSTQQDTSSAPSTQSSAEGTTPAQGTSQAGNEAAASSAGHDSSTAADGTYTGSVYSSPYGDMQVQVTMSAGTITQIQWLQLPSDGHSQRINSRAAQILIEEAIQAQSADVASVSGATYTSEGFKSSLQAALAQAGLS